MSNETAEETFKAYTLKRESVCVCESKTERDGVRLSSDISLSLSITHTHTLSLSHTHTHSHTFSTLCALQSYDNFLDSCATRDALRLREYSHVPFNWQPDRLQVRRQRERGIECKRDREREREREKVCVCVCAREREREREVLLQTAQERCVSPSVRHVHRETVWKGDHRALH